MTYLINQFESWLSDRSSFVQILVLSLVFVAPLLIVVKVIGINGLYVTLTLLALSFFIRGTDNS